PSGGRAVNSTDAGVATQCTKAWLTGDVPRERIVCPDVSTEGRAVHDIVRDNGSCPQGELMPCSSPQFLHRRHMGTRGLAVPALVVVARRRLCVRRRDQLHNDDPGSRDGGVFWGRGTEGGRLVRVVDRWGVVMDLA